MVKKPRKKSGSEIMFEELGKRSIEKIIKDIETKDIYWFLHLVAKGESFFYQKGTLCYNEVMAYLVLHEVGLVKTHNPHKLEQPFELTEKGHKVYQTLVREGVYGDKPWYSKLPTEH